MARRKDDYQPDESFLNSEMSLRLAEQYGTPLFVYDKKTLEAQIRRLYQAFSWNSGFRQYFPVRVLNNPSVLRVIHGAGCGVQCCNSVELRLARMAGIPGKDILFSACFPDGESWELAINYGATIVLDHGEQLEDIRRHDYGDRVIGLRLNAEDQHYALGRFSRNEHTKEGMFTPEILATIKRARDRGFRRFGLYLMPGKTGYLENALGSVTKSLLTLAQKIYRELGVRVEWCNIGGDVPWPTSPDNIFTTIEEEAEKISKKYEGFRADKDWEDIPLITEIGEYLVMPAGVLLTRVRDMKHHSIIFVGVDTSSAHMPRAVRKGIHYHVSKVKDHSIQDRVSAHLSGTLPDSDDMLTKRQCIPRVQIGDLLMIHDAGANGRAVSTNYCGNLRAAEVLIDDGVPRLISRRETFDDYIACLQRDEQDQ